jgi:hypothetical protein
MAAGERPLSPELAGLVKARSPLQIELRAGRLPIHSALLALVGLALLGLFALAVAGWLGVLEIATGPVAVLATTAAGVLAPVFLARGLVSRRVRVELTFEADRLVAVSSLGPWRWTRALSRRWARSVAVESIGYLGHPYARIYGCWLMIRAEPPARPLRIGRWAGIDPGVLHAVKDLVEDWLNSTSR